MGSDGLIIVGVLLAGGAVYFAGCYAWALALDWLGVAMKDDMTDADWRTAQWTVAVLGVLLMVIALCQGGCGAMPTAEAAAIPDRCACQCGPVEVSVGWADGQGKICAGAGAWRSCWALTGGE